MNNDLHHEDRNSSIWRSYVLAGLLFVSVIIVIALVGWYVLLWLVMHKTGSSLPSASDVVWFHFFATPLFWLAITGMGLVWFAISRVFHWQSKTIPLILLALIVIVGASMTGYGILRTQSISIESWNCPTSAMDAVRSSAQLETFCTPDTDAPAIAVGTDDEPHRFGNNEQEFNQVSRFNNLPAGSFVARVETTGNDATAQMLVGTLTNGQLDNTNALTTSLSGDASSRQWFGDLDVADSTTFAKVSFVSSGPAAPSATIAINVHSCSGTSLSNFDPAKCSEMMAPESLLVDEAWSNPSRDWRLPVQSSGDATWSLGNLEARTYVFSPSLSLADVRAEFILIPANKPQTATENIFSLSSTSGQATCSIEVTATSQTLPFNLYILEPGAPTIA